MPFDETFEVLAEMGFCGPLTVEMWAQMDDSGDPMNAVVAARQLVDRLVDTAWTGRATG